VFVDLMSYPYIFGPDFLHAVVKAKGASERDTILRDPPTTEQNIVVPATYLDHRVVQKVDTPPLENGETEVKDSEGDFGMLSLLVVLSERVDFAKAWPAVQGWDGDAMVAFRRKGTTCVRTDVAFDGTAGATTFASTFDEWAKGLPAKEERQGRFVRFESCDPGAKAATGGEAGHVNGIEGLELRRGIEQGIEQSGLPADVAGCITDRLITDLGAERLAAIDKALTANPNDPSLAELRGAATTAAAGCRR
jgi:hypothetical protein